MTSAGPRVWPIDGRSAFHEGVLQVLAAAQRTLLLIDPDFECWPLASRAAEDALRAALLRGVSLKLLVRQPDWLEREAMRFMRLRRTFAHQIECRQIPATHRDEDSAIIADHRHLVARAAPLSPSCVGHGAFDAPAQAREITDRYQHAWDEAEPCLPATTLGL